jgi:uncharacterized protein (AIM24 family)
MAQRSIEAFVAATAQDEAARERFELENPYLLELNLDGRVWAKLGTMIGYTGSVKFTREGVMEHGLGKLLKKVVTGEGTTLMKVEGRGRVYLADRGKKVRVLHLTDDTIFVNGNDLLAMEETLAWDITMMRRVSGMLAGGLFNIRLSGSGLVAITTHYDPVTLRVTTGAPLFTDPNATVAWSGSLSPDIHTDISMKTLIGRGSGESVQLRFSGDGWVVLQPYEEVYMQQSGSSS